MKSLMPTNHLSLLFLFIMNDKELEHVPGNTWVSKDTINLAQVIIEQFQT